MILLIFFYFFFLGSAAVASSEDCRFYGGEGGTCGYHRPSSWDPWCCQDGLKCELVNGWGTCVKDQSLETPKTTATTPECYRYGDKNDLCKYGSNNGWDGWCCKSGLKCEMVRGYGRCLEDTQSTQSVSTTERPVPACRFYSGEGHTCGYHHPGSFEDWCCEDGLKCELVRGWGTCVKDLDPSLPVKKISNGNPDSTKESALDCLYFGDLGSVCGYPKHPGLYKHMCCKVGLKCEMVGGYGECVKDQDTTPLATEKTVTDEEQSRTSEPTLAQCDSNEHYEECPKCPEWTCNQIRPLHVMAGQATKMALSGANDGCAAGDSTECLGKSGCYCDLGYARNETTGKCVLKAECHSRLTGKSMVDCGPNAHFEECPQWTDNKCEDLKKPRSKRMQGDPAEYCLNPGCRCDQGHALGQDGKCTKIGSEGCAVGN